MIVHQIFAQIYEGIVQNVIVCDSYDMANWLAKQIYGEEAIAIDCLQYPCAPGDLYRGGKLYRINQESNTEIEIEYIPTQKEQITTLTEELTNIQMVSVEQYETNIVLQDELTNTQLALTELFDRMEK